MKRILAMCLVLSIGALLCACDMGMLFPQTRKPQLENSEPDQIMGIPTDPAYTVEIVTEPEQETTAAETTIPTAVPETTAPVVTEPAETEPPATIAPRMEDWQKAYLAYLKNAREEYCAYALVYIDNDDVPELYLNGSSEATGDAVCTYKKDKVVELHLNRTGGGSYVPGTGMIKNSNGHMGYYATDIYKMTSSGFKCVWTGSEEEEYILSEDGMGDEIAYVYYIGDQIVSEEEYYAAIDAAFDSDRAVDLCRNTASYDAIRERIINW